MAVSTDPATRSPEEELEGRPVGGQGGTRHDVEEGTRRRAGRSVAAGAVLGGGDPAPGAARTAGLLGPAGGDGARSGPRRRAARRAEPGLPAQSRGDPPAGRPARLALPRVRPVQGLQPLRRVRHQPVPPPDRPALQPAGPSQAHQLVQALEGGPRQAGHHQPGQPVPEKVRSGVRQAGGQHPRHAPRACRRGRAADPRALHPRAAGQVRPPAGPEEPDRDLPSGPAGHPPALDRLDRGDQPGALPQPQPARTAPVLGAAGAPRRGAALRVRRCLLVRPAGRGPALLPGRSQDQRLCEREHQDHRGGRPRGDHVPCAAGPPGAGAGPAGLRGRRLPAARRAGAQERGRAAGQEACSPASTPGTP